ncbi:MAG: diaminopimelate epimerase [Planctomycetes bacterium]|nr:diaminopimelate epimerase [Planctomycetota bacterium]
MRFVKMHGCGNDYVYVDGFEETPPTDPSSLSKRISDRHTGVGSDGLILVLPSEEADAEMVMFNADGTPGEMCGNGLRCIGKLLFDRGHVRNERIRVKTAAGVRELQLFVDAGRVARVRVNMGKPILAPAQIPTLLEGDRIVDQPLVVNGRELRVTCVSMGNPHCVVAVDDVARFPVAEVGAAIERHDVFPRRTNVEFIAELGPHAVRQRTWERGSGETLACGSGACAVGVAQRLRGRSTGTLRVELRGGVLEVDVDDGGAVFLTGPAEHVFEGVWSSE